MCKPIFTRQAISNDDLSLSVSELGDFLIRLCLLNINTCHVFIRWSIYVTFLIVHLIMKVQEVKYLSDYTINIKFDDGIAGNVQLNDLVEKGIFKVLQDKNQFAKVYTNGNSIAWSNELEIDATTIYAELTGKHFGEILSPKLFHASN
jgi:hypothetical protein